MPNRVIKDSIWSSPTLAKLPLDAQLHWPRLLLMADDWGCFNADPDVILGMVYPKIKGMTTRKIDDLLSLYDAAGLMFLWYDAERRWGHFTSWNGHQYCNATNLDDAGKQQRHRRRTPEPPENELSTYLLSHYQIKQVVIGKLEQPRAACNNSIIPNPNPNPNPNPKEPPLPPKGFLVLPDWLPCEQWEAYLDMRKSIKRPLTTHGLRLALAILSKLRDDGHDPTAILNQSTLNNWKGLFALKGEQNEIRQHDRNRERGGHLSAGTGNDKGTPGKYAHLGTVLDCGEED